MSAKLDSEYVECFGTWFYEAQPVKKLKAQNLKILSKNNGFSKFEQNKQKQNGGISHLE